MKEGRCLAGVALSVIVACGPTPSVPNVDVTLCGSSRGDASERVRACDMMLTLYDENTGGYAAVLTWRAQAKEQSGDADGALADYRRALEIWPDAPIALLSAARIYMARDDLSTARPYLQRAIEAHDSVIARDLLAGEALLRGDNRTALNYYDAILARDEDDPMDAIGFYGRGLARLRMGDDGGRADIERAEQMSPRISESFAERGIRP